MRKNNRALFICQGAIIAAAYVVLTYLSSLFGLSSGAIQVRLSEMLCLLPAFTTAAIPGLYVGCLVSNLLTGAVWLDVLVGPVATLIGAIGTYAFRRYKWLAPLPPIFANALIVPFVLAYGYEMSEAIPYMMLTVGIGEVVSVGVLGMIFYFSIQKRASGIFGNI